MVWRGSEAVYLDSDAGDGHDELVEKPFDDRGRRGHVEFVYFVTQNRLVPSAG